MESSTLPEVTVPCTSRAPFTTVPPEPPVMVSSVSCALVEMALVTSPVAVPAASSM